MSTGRYKDRNYEILANGAILLVFDDQTKRAIFNLGLRARKMKLRTETRRALLSTLFVFGLLTWLYVVIVQMVSPGVLSAPLTHIDAFPFNLRVDVTGMVAFVVSALAFFFLQLTPKGEEKKQ